MKTNPEEMGSAAVSGPDPVAVRQMFSEIAPRYDFLNHLLSASIDRRWRRLAVSLVQEHLRHNRSAMCLDLCSGTGDLSIELCRRINGSTIIASDFCHPMLVRSLRKTGSLQDRIHTVEADSLTVPFQTAMFDAVTIGFGLRNLEDPRKGLSEMRRVLRPDGILVVLEFSRPIVPILSRAFHLYFHRVLPRIGAWISGQKDAYRYLPNSVRNFPSQNELAAMMEHVGFRNVSYRNLSGGIAALHWALK